MVVHEVEAAQPAVYTLEPLMEREPVALPVMRVVSALPCGIAFEYLKGNGDEASPVDSFDLEISLGTGWLMLTVAMKDGTSFVEVVDMKTVIQPWVDAAIAAGPTP
jgi:hypothetical protein